MRHACINIIIIIHLKQEDLPVSVFNPLPDDKILDWSKLKQIADDILSAFKVKK